MVPLEYEHDFQIKVYCEEMVFDIDSFFTNQPNVAIK